MADTSFLNKYSYFSHPGISVNEQFIRSVLLPGIISQAKLGSAGHVSLYYGQAVERLPINEAITLIIDWLSDTSLISAAEHDALLKTIIPGNYENLALLLNNKVAHQSQKSLSLTATLLENIERYEQAQKSELKPLETKSADILSDYNRLYKEIYRLLQLGIPADLAAQIIPKELANIAGSQYQTQALAQLIARNFSALNSARNSNNIVELTDHAVARELERIIRSSPKLKTLLVTISDPQVEHALSTIVATTANTLGGKNLEKLSQLEVEATQAASDLFPNHSEFASKLANILPFSTIQERQVFAKTLLEEIVRSSSKPLTTNELVELASRRFAAASPHINQIVRNLHLAGLDVALEYRQQEMFVLVSGARLTKAEFNLLKSGISPFLASYYSKKEALGVLTKHEAMLLSEFNRDHNPKSEPGKNYQTLEDAYRAELAKPSPNLHLLRRARHHFDEQTLYQNLSPLQEKLLGKTRFGRFVRDSLSRRRAGGFSFWDSYLNFRDNLPWNKATHKLFDWYYKLEDKLVIPLPFTKGKVKIPLLRPLSWGFGAWHDYKYRVATGWLKSLRGTKNPIGKLGHFTLRNYIKGDLSWGGMFYRGTREVWGRSLNSLVRLASRGKYTTIKAFGKASFKWLTETGAKLLAKVGGEALLKLGTKAAAALALAGTTIGAILSAGLAVLMVFDVLKLGYDFIREFISNVDFRNFVLKVGAIGNAAVLFVVNLPVILIGALGLATTVLPLALFITVGSIAFGTLYHRMASTAWQIDPGVGIITNIVCNLAGTDPTSVATDPQIPSGARPTLVAGQCIYDLLVKFGINPLTAENAVGSAWAGFAAALGNATAASIIQTSAVGQGVFQCVGYIAAAGEMAGKGFNPTNACLYVNNPPEGYSWTTKPTVGCFFVIASSTCSQCGLENAPANSCGHVGIVSAVNGAIINAMDANGTSPWGSVRVTAQFPTSSIAGYMCP